MLGAIETIASRNTALLALIWRGRRLAETWIGNMDKAEFDRFADAYYDQHRENIAVTGESPEYFAEYKIRQLRQIVERDEIAVSRICDFGSGIGNSIPFFRKYFPAAALTSSDVSERSLTLSQQRYPGDATCVLIENGRIPCDADAFDLVFSACVFHHIPHDEHVMWLRELYRVTRRGGLCAVFEHNPLNPLTVHAVNTCPFDENARLIFARDFAKRLNAAGWMPAQVQYNLFFPRGLARLRPLEAWLGWLPLGAQYVAFARKM
jgi:SAM-dependent methyltransferase